MLISKVKRYLGQATCVAFVTIALTACGESEPQTGGAPPDMRRLTVEQYRNVVHDVFGEHIEIASRFEPLIRTDGLFAVGASNALITPSGFEKFYNVARSVAGQVVDEDNRAVLVPCAPVDMARADDACSRQFFAEVGRYLYRRPLSESEMETAVSAANEVADQFDDFYAGIEFGLTGLLVTPSFLFIIDETEADSSSSSGLRLTGYAKAARLSFLLWNSAPDDMLLKAAAAGDLHTDKGVERQVERMIQSHLLARGVRAFFEDFLDLEKFETLEKDTIIYPAYTINAANSAKEQLLRTIVDHTVNQDAPYPEIFTTRSTFIDAQLGRIYRVPVTRPDGGWEAYEFPEDDVRAGILTQMGFLSLFSHPGRSSATLRGKAVRELLLCQKVPDPPGDVDFSLFNDPDAPSRTARERLTAHSTVPSCAGCHKLTDPIGLGFEQFDGIGQFRVAEQGAMIDVSGNLDGNEFGDAKSLAQAMHDSPSVPACLTNQLYSYAAGRAPERDEREFVRYLESEFAESGYSLKVLLRDIATSDAFYAVTQPKNKTEDVRAASLNSKTKQERGS
ncbi:MAG: DUF1592 domain-containing protein [Alphaproteobacteria bacterium]|nr:DUF1592 domain-containing protein [Alphaproteobacteria bacterium]